MNANIYFLCFFVLCLLLTKKVSCFERTFNVSCNKDSRVIFIETKISGNTSICFKNSEKLQKYFGGKHFRINGGWRCKKSILNIHKNNPKIKGNEIKFSIHLFQWREQLNFIKIYCLSDLGNESVILNGNSNVLYNNSGEIYQFFFYFLPIFFFFF